MRFFVAVSFAREKSHERASASDALWRERVELARVPFGFRKNRKRRSAVSRSKLPDWPRIRERAMWNQSRFSLDE
jgi:hypothetical protein